MSSENHYEDEFEEEPRHVTHSQAEDFEHEQDEDEELGHEEDLRNSTHHPEEPSHHATLQADHGHAEKPAASSKRSLLQTSLEALENENILHTENVDIGSDFSAFVSYVPNLIAIAQASFKVWKATETAKSWPDIAPLVEADIEAITNSFKVKVNTDLIEWIVTAALRTAETWAPLEAVQPLIPKEPAAPKTAVKAPSEAVAGSKPAAEGNLTLASAVELLKAKGYSTVSKENMKAYKDAHEQVHGTRKPQKKTGHLVPQGSLFGKKKKHPS